MFRQHGDEIAARDGQVDAVGGGRGGFRGVVVQHAAEVEFAGIERLGWGLLVGGERAAVWAEEELLRGVLVALEGVFLGAGEGADEFAHEVGEAEDGEEEDEEGLFGGAGGGGGGGAVGVGGAREALEGEEGGGREGGGVGRGGTAG